MPEKFDEITKIAIRKIANLPALFYGISQKKTRPNISAAARNSMKSQTYLRFFLMIRGIGKPNHQLGSATTQLDSVTTQLKIDYRDADNL